jgi:energy-coupling factor transporter ATP-binding protein EcfA2
MATRKRAKIKADAPTSGGAIARITVEGFKSIAKQTLELGRLNVLIGANGSGKTAILEAMGLLGAAVGGRVDTGELMRRGVRPSAPQAFMTALGEVPAKKIRLEAESTSGASYSVTLAPPVEEWPRLWRFEAERVEQAGKLVFRRKGDTAQLFSSGRRVQEIPLHGAGIGASMRALSLADTFELKNLFFTLSDAVIFDPKTPALRGLSAAEPLDPLGLDGSGLAPALKSLQTKDGGLGPLAREQVLALIDWASGIEIGRPDLDVASPMVPMTQEIVRFIDRRMTSG